MVVADVVRLGVRGAARKHGVASSMVGRWTKKYGSQEPVAKPEVHEPNGQGENLEPPRQRDSVEAAESGVRPESASLKQSSGSGPQAESGNETSSDEINAISKSERTTTSVARRYTPTQKAQALEYAAAHGVSAAAEKFGMSRFSIYQWRDAERRASQGQGPSPTSGPDPDEVEARRDREILAEWRKHPGLGPSQIRNQLRRRSIKVAVNTVRRVMIDAGYRPPKVKSKKHDERYEATRPNHLWHLDFLHRYINRHKTFILILLDDYSRFVVGSGVSDAERADVVLQTFEEAVQRHGRPEMIICDKGSAFWSWRGIGRFTTLLTELGVDQIVAEDKEWNGKLEAFNGHLQTELFDVYHFYDLAEMKRRLAAHLHWYNHSRTHHSLGGLLVPADRYYGRAEEVLARIEAGATREGLDSLQLDKRCLELFKVASERGATQVWLMGRKLFSLEAQK